MISQPVEVHQDHSGLRINLQRSKEDDAGAGLYDKTDEAGPLEKQSVQQKGRITITQSLKSQTNDDDVEPGGEESPAKESGEERH